MKTMPKEKKDLAVVEKNTAETPQSMIMQAIGKGASIETMERLFALQERWEANNAKKAFDLAMAAFQAELPEIKKLKEVRNDQGKLLYKYAPLESIIGQVKGILSKHGLSYSVKTEVATDKVKSIVIVKHIAGHSDQSEMETPLATKTGIMSQPQQIAATATFAKRYAFINALGIMTGESDNDEALKPATGDQVAEALKLLDQCKTLEALKETWSKFPKEIKGNREAIIRANEVKSYITNETSQHPTAK